MVPERYRRVVLWTLGLAIMALTGYALAQVVEPGLGDLDPDYRAWFSSPAALAITVGVFTAYLRNLLKLKDSNQIRLLGMALGVALSIVGAIIGELEPNVLTIVLFGVTAGITAGGGWDIATGLIAIVAKVFGIVLPGGTGDVPLSPDPTPVTRVRTVVIEKDAEPDKEADE